MFVCYVKQKTESEIRLSLVGSELSIRDRYLYDAVCKYLSRTRQRLNRDSLSAAYAGGGPALRNDPNRALPAGGGETAAPDGLVKIPTQVAEPSNCPLYTSYYSAEDDRVWHGTTLFVQHRHS